MIVGFGTKFKCSTLLLVRPSANTPPATGAAGAVSFFLKSVLINDQFFCLQSPRNAKLYATFKNIAGADDEIDAEELQDLMTATFSKG